MCFPYITTALLIREEQSQSELSSGSAGSQGSNGASGSDSGSSSDGEAAPDWLYQGWLTGWAYRACLDLYPWTKDRPPVSTPDGKLTKGGEDLLDFLCAYLNLVGVWGKTGSTDLTDGVDAMIDHVLGSSGPSKGPRAAPPSADQFGLWFLEIKGAARTKGPYVADVMEFASATSQWNYAPAVNQTQLFTTMREKLLPKIASAVPASAHEIVDDDIGRLLRIWKHDLSPTERIERWLVRRLSSDEVKKPAVGEAMKQLAREWSELILGARSARETLNWWGRATLYILLGILGTISFVLVGAGFFLLIMEIPALFGVAPSKLTFSDLSTILSIVAAVGIAIPALAKKVWGGLIAAEHQLAIKLTRVVTFRTSLLFYDLLWGKPNQGAVQQAQHR